MVKKNTMCEEQSVVINEATQRPKKQQRKGGIPNRFEPIIIKEPIASPSIISYFQELGAMSSVTKCKRSKVTLS